MPKSNDFSDDDVLRKVDELKNKSAKLSDETQQLITKMEKKNGEARDAMIRLKQILFL